MLVIIIIEEKKKKKKTLMKKRKRRIMRNSHPYRRNVSRKANNQKSHATRYTSNLLEATMKS